MGKPDPMMDNLRVIRVPETAELLNLSKSTLDKYRVTGEGPKFIRLGRYAVGYRLVDIRAWQKAREAQSTSEPRPPTPRPDRA